MAKVGLILTKVKQNNIILSLTDFSTYVIMNYKLNKILTQTEIKMSADNYAICHKCYPNPEDHKNLDMENHTLREDYEILAEEGNLYIDYSCACSRCGFSYKRETVENMN